MRTISPCIPGDFLLSLLWVHGIVGKGEVSHAEVVSREESDNGNNDLRHTHKLIKTLQASGIPEKQAEALAVAQQESLQAAFDYRDLATKGDLQETEHRIDIKLERITGEITLLKWMNGLIIGGIVALIIKTFFA